MDLRIAASYRARVMYSHPTRYGEEVIGFSDADLAYLAKTQQRKRTLSAVGTGVLGGLVVWLMGALVARR